MALRALAKTGADAATRGADRSSVISLYRSIIRELPRVMAIYDIDLPYAEAKKAIRYQFHKNSKVQDGRIIGVLLSKGYMELEETLMQWKQKTHLLQILQPDELSEEYKARNPPDASINFWPDEVKHIDPLEVKRRGAIKAMDPEMRATIEKCIVDLQASYAKLPNTEPAAVLIRERITQLEYALLV